MDNEKSQEYVVGRNYDQTYRYFVYEGIDHDVQALWVFPEAIEGALPSQQDNEVATSTKRMRLIEHAATSGVDALYVSVHHHPENDDGLRLYETEALNDLINRAHAEGIEVWAAFGDPRNVDQWASDDTQDQTGFHTHIKVGCDPSTEYAWAPIRRLVDIQSYHSLNDGTGQPVAKFDGVILDIEVPATSTEIEISGTTTPHVLPGWEQRSLEEQEKWFATLLDLYQCFIDTLHADNIKVGAAIPAFWDTTLNLPDGSEPYRQIIDLDLDNVVVMGFWDDSSEIQSRDQAEIDYADSQSKESLILVGLETSNCAPSGECESDRVTFFEEGESAMNTHAEDVRQHFDSNLSFGGFAVHRYYHPNVAADVAYLAGSTDGKWPEFNTGIPTEID